MKKLRSITVAVGALTAAAVLSACAGGDPPESGDTATVRLAQSTSLSWPQSVVATEFGLWEPEGLAVKTTDFATGREALQAVLGGGADIAQVSPSPVTLGAFDQQPITVIATTGQWDQWSVIVKTDSGIAKASDLVGTRVGVTLGTSSEIAFRKYLEQNGVDAEGIEFVNVSPPDMVSALSTGSVDAVNPWQPTAYELLQDLGDSVTELRYEYPNNYLLVALTDYVDENPDIVEAFLDAMTAADAAITEDPQASAEAVAAVTQLEVDSVLAIWEGYVFDTQPAGADVVTEMTDVAEASLASGTVTGDVPDFEAMFLTW